MTAKQTTQSSENSTAGADSTTGAATDSRATRNRILWLVALIGITFFFDGCESGNPEFTLGAVPFAQVSFGDLGWGQPCKLLDVWPVGLFLNFVVLGGLLILLLCSQARWVTTIRRFLSWKTTWVSAIVTVGIFNSFLIIPGIWMWGVFTPTGWLLEPFGKEPSIWITRFAGRVLFVLWILLLSGTIYGAGRILSKYVMVEKRWWQFSMGGLFALMVILGTLIGIIGRIVLQNGN